MLHACSAGRNPVFELRRACRTPTVPMLPQSCLETATVASAGPRSPTPWQSRHSSDCSNHIKALIYMAAHVATLRQPASLGVARESARIRTRMGAPVADAYAEIIVQVGAAASPSMAAAHQTNSCGSWVCKYATRCVRREQAVELTEHASSSRQTCTQGAEKIIQ